MGEGKNNPQAFPSMAPPESWGDPSTGMSLRDWFAGQALAGLMMKDPWGDPMMHAAYAYCAADAMLAARSENNGE